MTRSERPETTHLDACPERARERALVERFRRGDQAAFAEIYARHYRLIYAFTLRRVGDPAEAEDLTQETFVQAFRSLPSFEGRSSLSTWIFGIAQHVCARFFRHCSRWMMGPRYGREFEDSPVEARTERRVDAARALDRCGEALETNRRSAHREIFRLRYAESQSIKTIATRTGRSSEAVKLSLRRSRAVLSNKVPELSAVIEGFAQPA